MPEGKEEEQEFENLFEKIMKENFPNLEGSRHTSPGSTENPKQIGPKETTPIHIIIKCQRLTIKRES